MFDLILIMFGILIGHTFSHYFGLVLSSLFFQWYNDIRWVMTSSCPVSYLSIYLTRKSL